MHFSVIPYSVTNPSWRWQHHQIPARTCHRMWSSVWNRKAGLLNVLGISRWRWQCVGPHEHCGIRGCLSGGLPCRWRVPLGSMPWGCPTVTPIDQLRLHLLAHSSVTPGGDTEWFSGECSLVSGCFLDSENVVGRETQILVLLQLSLYWQR